MDKAFKKYKQVFDQFVDLNAEEWALFRSKIKIYHFKKGEIIHHAGEVCRKLFFINYGIVRSYAVGTEGNDYTWGISFNDENSIVSNIYLVDYDSFISQEISKLSFEVVEDCQLLAIAYDDLQSIYRSSKNGERFGRLMAEQAYSYAHNLILDRLTKTASMRYQEFIENTPYLLDKVPQYHIATFLGITPQSLSRIKKEIILCE